MLYLNEEVPCKFLDNHPILPNVEIICIELHELKRKWLLLGYYKPPTQSDFEFIASITKTVDFYLQKFENLFIITDDLNMTTENTHLNYLLQIYDLTALIQEPTCYQPQNANCIDHFLKNPKTLFKHFQTFETGLSYHHKPISTIMKSSIFKGPTKKKIYQSYKKFDNECFGNALRVELEPLEGDTYGEFKKNNTKMIGFNNNIFMTKGIVKRSKLRNKFNRNRNHENWCNF